MENIYLILIIVLFALAISDLIVGVSNDAVNFLNSAVGAKAGTFKVIMLVAALGVFIGAAFSSGMMEVARKGIFHPEQFYFNEIIIIFLAVMITDVILLDFFNTIGFPTSTTVSIVFELLGAAVAVSLIKISQNADIPQELNTYINSASALKIIFGILLSVIVAFTVGAIIQYLVRIMFTFEYSRTMKQFGSVYGGFAVAIITYFILIKGAKGATFMSDATQDFIKHNALMIQAVSFVGFTIVFQILGWFTRFNILKFIVLIGTFALAMAFAGNDLVNFIGVPMAGFESFKLWMASGSGDVNSFLMSGLAEKIDTNPIFLFAAGLIMVVTLYTSRKAKRVIKTSVDLGRQDEGEERFGSSFLARSIVRTSRTFSESLGTILPAKFKNSINKRFDPLQQKGEKGKVAAFDLVRASVILVVSSALISYATSLKLPLSTTYVTFMVAMGASLSDRAWGRESAVYRITGVISIIGGWFVTAISAFSVAFGLAILIQWTKTPGIIFLILTASVLIYRTHMAHRRKIHKEEASRANDEIEKYDDISIQNRCTTTLIDTLKVVSVNYENIVFGLIEEDRRKLKKALKNIKELNEETKLLKDNSSDTILKMREDDVETGHYYVQVLDYLREIAHCLSFIVKPAFNHVDNNHKELVPEQVNELRSLSDALKELLDFILFVLKEHKYDHMDEIIYKQQLILDQIAKFKKLQVKRIKNKDTGTRNTMLYMELMAETKNLLLFTINLLKSQRDFMSEIK